VGGIRSPGKALAGKAQSKKPEAKAVASRIEPPALPEGQPSQRKLKAVVPRESEGELTLRILADGPVHQYRKFFMESPSRLVIDLEGEWAVPGFSILDVQSELVMRIRTGRHEAKLRIVLDLKERERIHSAIISPSPEGLTVILRRD
jgi:hypothetical protein